jgi:tight adherence protein B
MNLNGALAGAVLASVAAGGLAYVFVYPLLSGEKRAEKRQKALVDSGPERRLDRGGGVNRRDQVAQTLKDLEAKQKAQNKLTIELRINQAGLTWTKQRFFLISGGLGLFLALMLFVISGSPIAAAGGLFVGAVGIPRWLLGYLKARRIKRFLEELPNAIDVIVRGVKAGLPLGDCLRIVATEGQEPLKTEFKAIIDAQSVGITVGEAVGKLYEHVPIAEANFFAIVIAIQQKAGGNLSEALGNLSRVLRDRRKMAGKIKAMSTEAKASAGIIACLPFTVGILTWLSSPSYIQLLWTTQTGKVALVASGLWMLMGVFVMKKMVAFDY